jgi:hypothetical protein
MAHNYMPLSVALIPEETKARAPTFKLGCFSNESKRYLIPAYLESGKLCHNQELLLSWLQWEYDPQLTLDSLIEEATPYIMTLDELKVSRLNPDSIWYVQPEIEG